MGKKNLMIVESPAKAKTIEKYLGPDFVVKASMGHVCDLPKADDAIDVNKGFEPKYEVLPDKKEVIKELKKLAQEAESVWLATDEDREGEAISWHLAKVLDLDLSETNRVVFNEITKKAVTEAVGSPRQINIDLVNAQQARRVLDRLVGFHLSPVLWSKVRTGLSAGRVQSVAVRLIVQREREIMSFKESSNFRVLAEFNLDGQVLLVAELRDKVPDAATAQAFLESCVGAVFEIKSMETKPGKRSPAAPFTTSTLQQEASRKLGFSVAQTMRVAQGLYESGHITYMRTDSVSLSDFAIAQAKEVVTRNYGANYSKTRKYQNKVANAQEAHEAIRPTDMGSQTVPGENQAQRLYDLIWKRTVASQMEDAALEKTVAVISVSTNNQEFVASGEVIKFDGFLKVYMEGRDEEQDDEEGKNGMLPPLKVGQILSLNRITAKQRYAKHPPRYTEATLVKKLEELGIGRPSTFATTISTVQKRDYVVRESREGEEKPVRLFELKDNKVVGKDTKEVLGAEKNKMFPTDLGMLVTDFLIDYFPTVLDFEFTAKVEEEFDEIANGKMAWNEMIGEFYTLFSATVQQTKDEAKRVSKERTLGVDPVSGEEVWAKFGKYGPFIQLGSSDAESKPRYAKLRADQRLDSISLQDALELFKLPRILGELEGLEIKVNVGRFGPYVQLGKEFFSIPKGEDAYTVSLERAVEIIDEKRNAEKNKVIKELAPDVQVLNGRFGPYVKMQGENLKIPKGKTPEELTLEDCKAMLEEQKDKPKKRPFKRK